MSECHKKEYDSISTDSTESWYFQPGSGSNDTSNPTSSLPETETSISVADEDPNLGSLSSLPRLRHELSTSFADIFGHVLPMLEEKNDANGMTGDDNGKDDERGKSSSSSRLTDDVESWEDNWLFRKKRTNNSKSCNINSLFFSFADLDFASEPVRMLIPNPDQPTQTLIGEEDVVNLDDLSEGSERNSVASLLFSSSEEEEEEDQPRDDNCHPSPGDQAMTPDDSILDCSLRQLSSTTTRVDDVTTQGLGDNRSTVIVIQGDKDGKSRDMKKKSTDTPSFSSNNNTCIIKNNMQLMPHPPSPSSTTRPSFVLKSLASNVRRREIDAMSIGRESDPSSSDSNVSLPAFVPLSMRMESCRSDPSFVIKPHGPNKPVHTDILIQFVCRIRGTRPLGVAWFKGDTLLVDDDAFRIFHSGSEHVLEIKKTQVDHSDHYSCVVYNGFGEQWADFKLTVNPTRVSSPIRPSTKWANVSPRSPSMRDCTSANLSTLSPSPRGINVDSFSKGSTQVVTRTWGERTNPETAGQKRDNKVRVVGSSVMPYIKERESDAQSTSSNDYRSSLRPTHPEKSVSQERPVIYSSLTREKKSDSPPTCIAAKQKEPQFQHQQVIVVGDGHVDRNHLSDDKEGNVIYSGSKSHDLSVYSRDYFVPSKLETDVKTRHDRQLNDAEDKVFDDGKHFSPDDGRRGSGTESVSYFSSKSSREEGLGSEDDERDRGSDDLPRSPSVQKLVRHFSIKDLTPIRSPTLRSSQSIHDECNGRGVTPRSTSSGIEVYYSLTARSFGRLNHLHQHPSSFDKANSISLYNIDRVPESISPRSCNNNSSPSTEGYTSDDSALCASMKKSSSPVQVMQGNRVNRKLTKRGSFWQTRCERGLLSDTQVNEDFPELEVVLFN